MAAQNIYHEDTKDTKGKLDTDGHG